MARVVDFDQAERNARKRDFENESEKFKQDHHEVSKEDLEKALQIVSKATGKDTYIGTKKSPQSKVRFAQFLQINWEFIRSEKYLTTEEKVFLIDIQSNISMHSNAIVDDIKKKPAEALNIPKIAEIIGTSRTKISRVVNSLIRKGLLAKAVSGDTKNINKAHDYVLFVNPNVIYVGDKDDVEEHLVLMFKKQMNNNLILKKLPQRLF